MNEEELIVHVQSYRFLYDLTDTRYSNTLIRENAWEEIGSKMKCKAVDCKNKWKSLRDCYRKALKVRATKSGQAAMNKKPWKFEKQMEFLKQYVLSERDGKSNVQPPQSACCVVSDDETNNTEISQTSSREPTPVESPLASPGTSASIETLGIRKRKKNASTSQTPASVAFQEYMEYKKLKDNKPVDHLTKYFASVEETLRTFPLHLQIKIKSEFSSILHKAEYEAMSYSNQSKDSQQPSPIQNATQFNKQSPLSCNLVQQTSSKFSSLRPQNQEAHISSQEITLQTLGHTSPTYPQQQSLQTWMEYPQPLTYHTLEGKSQYNLSESSLSRQEMPDNHQPHYSDEDASMSPS